MWKQGGRKKKISEIIDETSSLEEVSSFFLYDYLKKNCDQKKNLNGKYLTETALLARLAFNQFVVVKW